MRKIKVISSKNLPTRLPFLSTAVIYLYLDKYNPVGWVWGVAITLISINWLIGIIILILNEPINIFKNK